MDFPAIAVGGPEAAAGLVRGDWEFAHTGALPVAEQVLMGRDVVIVLTPTCEFGNSFVVTRPEISDLAQLDGKKVGVVTETGQTSVAARLAIEKAGASATYLPLLRFDRISAELAGGEIDAGTLPVEVRFGAQERYRWNAFALNEFGTPSAFATTRRLIASNRELVMRVMQCFAEAIQVFKTRPDIVVPMLQRYVKIEDRGAADRLHAFHVPLFQNVPRPSFPGMSALRAYLLKTFPTAVLLRDIDISDASLISELGKNGFIDGLYAEHTG